MSAVTTARPPAPGRATHPGRAGTAPGPGGFTHRQILTILGGLMLGMFLAALDQTIVSTAIRTIADDLHGLDAQAWATTAYLITSTISTPLYGKLSDLYGRKPFFLTGISIFLVGSILCTISTSMYELAAFRALQGLGAGGLMSLALAIIGDIVPPRERARYQGYFLAVFGTSSVIGPLIGGAFAGASSILGLAGWRWVFLVNVPIGVVALIVVARVLNIPHLARKAVIDWGGAATLALGIVPLLLVAEQGRDWGWGSAGSIICFVVAALGLAAFVVLERRMGDAALIPLRLFRNSTFSLTSVAGVVVGMGMFGGIALLPQYLQIVKGATPTESGLLMLPLVLGLMIGAVVSGQITSRTGRYKIFPVVGTLLMIGGMLLMWQRVGADSHLWEVDIYMAMFGLGVGLCMQTLTLAVQNAAPAKDMGVTTSTSTMFRQLGGTLGTAVFLSILFSSVTDRITDAFTAIAPTPEFRAALADPAARANPANAVVFGGGDAGSVLTDSSFLQRMDPRLARPFLVGFSDAMDTVFLVAACIIVLAFVLLLFMKELPLRSQSGLQARTSELAGEGAVLDPSGVDAVAGVRRAEQLMVPAIALAALARHVEQADHGRGSPHLTAAVARLAPHAGADDAERARAAAQQVLRPVAARALVGAVAELGAGGPRVLPSAETVSAAAASTAASTASAATLSAPTSVAPTTPIPTPIPAPIPAPLPAPTPTGSMPPGPAHRANGHTLTNGKDHR